MSNVVTSRLALLLTLCVPGVLGAIVSLDSFRCEDGNVLQIRNVALSCNGITECKMGQVSTLDGELTLSEDLDSDEIYVDAVLKKFHLPLVQLYRRFPTEFCDETTSTSGSECPSAGSYSFSADVTIPHMSRFVTGWTVTAAADFFDDHDRLVGKCVAVISTESSWGGNATTGIAATIGGLALAGLFVKRRRRLRAITEEERREAEAREIHFNRMDDQVEMSRSKLRDFKRLSDPMELSRTASAQALDNSRQMLSTVLV